MKRTDPFDHAIEALQSTRALADSTVDLPPNASINPLLGIIEESLESLQKTVKFIREWCWANADRAVSVTGGGKTVGYQRARAAADELLNAEHRLDDARMEIEAALARHTSLKWPSAPESSAQRLPPESTYRPQSRPPSEPGISL